MPRVHDELMLVASEECDAVFRVVSDGLAKAGELGVPLDDWVGFVARRHSEDR